MKRALIVILIVFSVFTVGCKSTIGEDTAKDNDNQVADSSITENQDEKDKTENTFKEVEDKAKENEKQDEAEAPVSKYSISDYIGINANEKYNYSGENSEYAEYFRYVEYIEGDKFQIRTNNGATETVMVLEGTDNELKIVFRRGVCDYRENFLKKPSNESEVLLKAPIKKGTEWKLSDGAKRYISSIDTVVSTSIGEFQCVEVTTENVSGQKDLKYYAPNIGIVKEVNDTENMKVTSTLSSIEKDVRFNQVIRFYSPDENAEYMKYEDVTISFATNDITRLTLQNRFEEYGMLKGNVGINSLYLNDDGMVYLDVTKNFVPEMANGTAGEYFAIYDLVNTIGRYYGVNNVYMTLDGGNYESGHIVKYKGESFAVDLSRVQ